jgi:ATPase subunit of ABC transporter with duplicated ATPase domains
VLSLLARLGSDPEHALAGGALSPGEARKLMIAIGVASRPQLILLDEPTNHLDIMATEALEEALSSYAGALVIVSHDSRFVARLATTHWQLAEGGDGVTTVSG